MENDIQKDLLHPLLDDDDTDWKDENQEGAFQQFGLVGNESQTLTKITVEDAKGIITDSGGITEEATFFKVPCFTMRENTERPETINVGSNVLIGNNYNLLKRSINEVNNNRWKKSKVPEKWDGKTAYRILNIIDKIIW